MNIFNKIISARLNKMIEPDVKEFLINEIERLKKQYGNNVCAIIKHDGNTLKIAVAVIDADAAAKIKIVDSFAFKL